MSSNPRLRPDYKAAKEGWMDSAWLALSAQDSGWCEVSGGGEEEGGGSYEAGQRLGRRREDPRVLTLHRRQ